jgi:hypothetical protein
MMFKRWSIVLTAAAAMFLVSIAHASQRFDTPNRSFHNATAFRLDGQHQTVACEACHVNGQYKGTPTTCFSCHWVRRQDDRFQTRLGTQCEQCHRPTSWTAVRWDHAGAAGVQLNADHRQIACESCHKSASFRAVATLCVSCHQKDYAATKSPNHLAANYPTTCDSCHSPGASTWQNVVSLNHNAVFPLVGLHATATCTQCHVNNVFAGTRRDCVGCHQANYNATSNPNHIAAGFPVTCDSCHRANDPDWLRATFTHTWFPLTSNHNVQCAQCHTTTNNFAVFSCTVCHSQSQTNSKHSGVGGYVYTSTACYSCHPNGRAG